MNDPLAPLLADGVIDEVVARLKSGKEADVWLVRHGGEILAAKVYKARHARSFRNDAAYREGRQVRNTRTQRAMDRGTRFGQAAAEDAWKAKESDALHRLHAAGVRVPRPVLFFEGVLLMEVVVDAHGHPAPRLVDAQVPREQASAMYADLRRQAIGMLACDLIHGDLSPYNILVGASGPVIIDLPQVVGAAHNSQAEAFFLRDLHNIQRFFAALDPALRAAESDGREIWRAYVRRELTADFIPTSRPPEARRPQHPQHGAHAQGQHAQGQHAQGQHAQGQHAQGQHAQGQPPRHARPQGSQGHGRPPAHGHGPARPGPGHPPRQHAGPQGQGGRPQGQGGRPQPQDDRPRSQGGRPPGPGGRPPAQGGRPPSRGGRPPGQDGRPQTPQARRQPSAPEVVRVMRLPQPPHGGGAGPSGAGPGPAGPHGRRGRRR